LYQREHVLRLRYSGWLEISVFLVATKNTQQGWTEQVESLWDSIGIGGGGGVKVREVEQGTSVLDNLNFGVRHIKQLLQPVIFREVQGKRRMTWRFRLKSA
jgi:hypothetical protein